MKDIKEMFIKESNYIDFDEDEIFALGSFFMEFGWNKAKKWFHEEYKNPDVEKDFESAIDKLMKAGNGE